MTDQALKLSAVTIAQTIAERRPPAIQSKSGAARIARRLARSFRHMTEDYGKQAKPFSFKGIL